MNLLPLAPPGVTPVRALTIAGSDSGGGAGIEADLRTFALSGVHGCVALTAVTAQNSVGVHGVAALAPEFVAQQIRVVVRDIGVAAVKTGMLANAAIIEAVVETCRELGIGRTVDSASSVSGQSGGIPLVVDPVCASMHGDPLLAADALDAVRELLLPIATVVTPNLDEVRLLTGVDVVDDASYAEAGALLRGFGAQWSLVKGGHLRGDTLSRDLLSDGETEIVLTAERVPTGHDHGAGDTLSSAMTCALAHGYSVPDAGAHAKSWITASLAAAYPLGAGHGPVSPLWRLSL